MEKTEGLDYAMARIDAIQRGKLNQETLLTVRINDEILYDAFNGAHVHGALLAKDDNGRWVEVPKGDNLLTNKAYRICRDTTVEATVVSSDPQLPNVNVTPALMALARSNPLTLGTIGALSGSVMVEMLSLFFIAQKCNLLYHVNKANDVVLIERGEELSDDTILRLASQEQIIESVGKNDC